MRNPKTYRYNDNGRLVPIRNRVPAAPLDSQHRAYWIRHRKVLQELGRETLGADWPSSFRHSGCIALTMAAIEAGHTTRNSILAEVKQNHSTTYEHVGYLLGQMCGPDPEQHLWFKNAEGHYQLHDTVPKAKLAV